MDITKTWYDVFADKLKEKLKLKVLSMYILEDSKKDEYIMLIKSINDVDLLIELEYKLDEILQRIWKLTVDMLQNADKEFLWRLQASIQQEIINIIKKKEFASQQLELSELERKLDELLKII